LTISRFRGPARISRIFVAPAALALSLACACGGDGGHAPAFPAASATAAPGVVSYEIVFDEAKRDLLATATFPPGVATSLDVEDGVSDFVADATVEAKGKTRVIAHDAKGFAVPECARAACVVRYRVRLRDACTHFDDVEVASIDDGVLEAPPPTWLLAPWGAPGTTKLRFRVKTPRDATFVTGVLPAPDASGASAGANASGGENAFELTMYDLPSAPYTAFGAMRTRTLEVGGGKLAIGIAPGALAVTDAEIDHWITTAATAVSSYYERFPISREAVLLFPSRGAGVGFGKSLAGGGATVLVRIGSRAKTSDLDEDWVLTHELVHAAFPAQPRSLDWVEEGLATYVEPFARARVGALSDEGVWRGFVNGLEYGLPEEGDRGIDRTHTWGRTYWGGALFFFVADVEIRRQTQGKKSVRDALVAILRDGGNNTARTPLEEALAIGDRATGTNVLAKQHAAWAETPVQVDVKGMLTRLGVSMTADGQRIVFDDAAPDAAMRKSMTARASLQ
jgi:hypothetical protein